MILRVGRTALEALQDLFFPLHCAGCEERLAEGWMCAECRADIHQIEEPRCEMCSQPFSGVMETFVCSNCKGRVFSFDCAVTTGLSRGVLRDLIHRLKYGKEVWLAHGLADMMAEGLRDKRLTGRRFDALVPVPLHALRERDRDFNQAELLAKRVGKQMNLPVRSVLWRCRQTMTQTHFDRQRRMQNLRDAFRLRQNASVQGLDLLLVDDVFTTGSTLDECARVLREAGAKSVCALTLARG